MAVNILEQRLAAKVQAQLKENPEQFQTSKPTSKLAPLKIRGNYFLLLMFRITC